MSYPIIGLVGQKNSGKSTVAKIYVDQYSAVEVAFAAPMKKIAEKFFPYENVYGSSEKREGVVPVDFGPFGYKLSDSIDEALGRQISTGPSWVPKMVENTEMSARYFLQQLGTEFGRSSNPSIWVDIAMDTADSLLSKGAAFVVISDVRFLNEALAIKKAGGVLVKITSREEILNNTVYSDTHQSETEQLTIPSAWISLSIINGKNGLECLRADIRNYANPRILLK